MGDIQVVQLVGFVLTVSGILLALEAGLRRDRRRR